jgi:hypothetical protein
MWKSYKVRKFVVDWNVQRLGEIPYQLLIVLRRAISLFVPMPE